MTWNLLQRFKNVCPPKAHSVHLLDGFRWRSGFGAGMSAQQLSMFEPSGPQLAELVRIHSKNAAFDRVVSLNLVCAGFISAAQVRATAAAESEQKTFVCEMALQFEQLAGLV